MKIFFQCKKSLSGRQIIEPVLLELKTKPENVAGLIGLIVERFVEGYNGKPKIKPDDSSILVKPKEEFEIQNLSATGKIAFGLIYNDKPVEREIAIKTALTGYYDGLFKIFLNNEMLGDLESEVSIKDGDLLTVVRLTFLSGRIV